MATILSISLSTKYPEWARVFSLQNQSKFSEALQACDCLPLVDSATRLYAELVKLILRICSNASNGIHPAEKESAHLREIALSAASSGLFEVQVEAWLLLFDGFPHDRDEALSMLSQLETNMNTHTKRRWAIRRGQSLVASGQLQEAYDFWLPFVGSSPEETEDADDSLCSLLLEFGRVNTELGKYSDAVDIYNQALSTAKTAYNQGLALIRVANALERMSRPAQADKRRIEYFNLVKREYPTQCALCSGNFGKEPKFLITCCKTIAHSECLRQVVSEIHESETHCPFCSTKFLISDVVDPGAVEGRKYKKTKRGGHSGEQTPLMKTENPHLLIPHNSLQL